MRTSRDSVLKMKPARMKEMCQPYLSIAEKKTTAPKWDHRC